MATSRPFSYNAGSPIGGTDQVGDLAIGYPTEGFESTGLQWWNGPDEDLGYVIAKRVLSGSQPNPLDIPAYVGFNRSVSLTEASFVSLANVIAGPSGPFSNGADSKTWLNANGYWTSYEGATGSTGATSGNYSLLNVYSPANSNGSITFPNSSDVASNNPNIVGLNPGNGIYINKLDLSGNDQSSVLDSLLDRAGTLTLTQGVNSVTYSFTSTAFNFTASAPYANQYWWDNYHNEAQSPLGTLTVTSPSASNFNYVDPIIITVS
jgi:hypothetical protein